MTRVSFARGFKPPGGGYYYVQTGRRYHERVAGQIMRVSEGQWVLFLDRNPSAGRTVHRTLAEARRAAIKALVPAVPAEPPDGR